MKGARIPRYDIGLFDKRKGKDIHVQIPRQIARDLLLDMNGSVKTPAVSHLYIVNKEAVKMLEETSPQFHHLVAKIIYLSHRTRQELKMQLHSYVQGCSHWMWMTTKNWLD